MLAFCGVFSGAVVAFLGKKGENAVAAYSTLTDQLQEERDRLDRMLSEKNAVLAAESAARASAEAENARLIALVARLGGDPS
jgi:hypothetical protein